MQAVYLFALSVILLPILSGLFSCANGFVRVLLETHKHNYHPMHFNPGVVSCDVCLVRHRVPGEVVAFFILTLILLILQAPNPEIGFALDFCILAILVGFLTMVAEFFGWFWGIELGRKYRFRQYGWPIDYQCQCPPTL